MSTERVTDPTAGERAAHIKLQPDQVQPILDPTDPRSARSASLSANPAAEASESSERDRLED